MTNHTNEPFTASMNGTAAAAKRAEDEYYEQQARKPVAWYIEAELPHLPGTKFRSYTDHRPSVTSEHVPLYAAPPPPRSDDAPREEMSPDFTDSARAAIAWVLYHHQGGKSAIGQPLRFALGMGAHEPLQEWRIAEAKRWAACTGSTTADFHAPCEAAQEPGSVCIPRDELERTIKTLRYASHPAPSPHADALAKYLTESQQREGAPLRPVTDGSND